MKQVLLFLWLLMGGMVAIQAAPIFLPNFIVILGEGSGWTSSSVQMDDRNPASKGTGVRTPSLERLAAAGMRFSDGYAPHAKLETEIPASF